MCFYHYTIGRGGESEGGGGRLYLLFLSPFDFAISYLRTRFLLYLIHMCI